MTMKEKDYYEPVKNAFEKLFNEKGTVYLEITSDKPLSNKLKAQTSKHRDIIFYFLKEAKPDITGFLQRDGHSNSMIVIEVKKDEIKLDNIYQARKYGELLETQFVFLVSPKEIPEEIKKLSSVTIDLLSLPYYKKLVLCQFDEKANQIVDWYEENPFMVERFWS